MLLALLIACPDSASTPSTDKGAEAWPEWEDEAQEEASPDSTGSSEADDEADEVDERCEPDACIELAEAVDRGFAAVYYGTFGMEIENDGPYPVCFERWYTFLSASSQDAVAGTTGAAELEPGHAMSIPYADWGTNTESWWCIEHNQYTSSGADYTFNGSRAPTAVATWANDASDEDRDGDEDHTDLSLTTGLPQTQENIWDYIDSEPVFIVGRSTNWFEVRERQSVEVVLEVVNLGRESGSATVMERVPAGWVVSGVSPSPVSEVDAGGGVTQLTWNVSLDAAVEPSNTYDPTSYDSTELRYVLSYAGSCEGREQGYAPWVSWIDGNDQGWSSEGAPLILQCCDDNDEGSGGLGDLPH